MSNPLTDDLGYTPYTRQKKARPKPAPAPSVAAPKPKPKVSVHGTKIPTFAPPAPTSPLTPTGSRYLKAEDVLVSDCERQADMLESLVTQMERLATTSKEMTETLNQLRMHLDIVRIKLDEYKAQASVPPTAPYISVPTTLKSDPAPDWWKNIF